MTHLRTKRKPTSKNIAKLIFNVFLIFVFMGFVYSLGFVFKNKENKINKEENYTFSLNTKNLLTTKDDNKIFIELATTTEARDIGLSYKDKLNFYTDKDQKKITEGMLFVFEYPQVLPFWMKDMKFDIDMIWLDENFKVVHIEKNALASSYNKEDPNFSVIYKNDEKSLAKYVLEINSGLSDILNINIGDILTFN